MSALLARIRGVFVEPPADGPQAVVCSRAARRTEDALVGAVAVSPHAALAAAVWGPMRAATPIRPPAPTIVVLCAPSRGRGAAAAVGLAIARVLGAPCAVAAVVGGADVTPSVGLRTPATGHAATVLRARGNAARTSGRLVWLPDRRPEETVAADPAGAAAAASAELGRAVAATGLPGVLAIPLMRSDALDRVIAWHDGIVVVREPDATALVADRVAESLAALGRPLVGASPLSRQAAVLAELGLRAPLAMVQAVQRLQLA